ncbi:MAG: hypothetical protein EON86_14745 [Brevundimonas sp.]|nr:MAG: hypothetical protein EON86_14745 [Brevundimonas sp.]
MSMLLLMAALAVQNPASSAQAPQAEHVIEDPQWIRFPQVDFERLARDGDIPVGEVVLNCAVTVEGRLTDCVIVSDTSRSRRLGPAARRAARAGLIQPRRVDGLPELMRVSYTIRIEEQN